MTNMFGLPEESYDLSQGFNQAASTVSTRAYATRRSQSFDDKNDIQRAANHYAGQLEKPKPVKFIYSHARLPLRVHIKKHDTTDSIITIVKTFFGIHGNVGVSFENDGGYNIIPKYENVNADTDIQVRLTQELQPLAQANVQYHNEMTSPAKSLSSAPWMAVPPSVHTSRPASRNTRGDISPDPSRKQRGISIKGHKYSRTYDADGLSDSDAGSVSVTSSRRDVLVSADISVENIVEGNRRKGAKFESSELPLFKPPQIPMTASISSASPQKRFYPSGASPLPPTNHRNFSAAQAFPSPVSYAYSDKPSNPSQYGYGLTREPYVRTPGNHQTSRLSGGSNMGILPTPAPTLASGLSDEDAAFQLMRLGNPNSVPPPRHSTSTNDDALSGKAEHASSAEYSGDESEDLPELPRCVVPNGPARKKLKALNTAIPSGDTHSSEEEYEDTRDSSFKGYSDEMVPPPVSKKSKSKSFKAGKSRRGSTSGQPGPKLSSSKSKSADTPAAAIPPSPYSASGAQSKGSASQFASDEEDLSSKPRCQRCRKSKKGCDRQRPCARCKDAGIGIEGCVSEDEGNGRKGRFGRHMGVAVKRPSLDSIATNPSAYSPHMKAEPIEQADVNKKRKR